MSSGSLICAVTLLTCLCVPPPARSATVDPSPNPTPVHAFRAFDRRTDRGLPQSSIMSMVQDEEGVLWIGTLDGVARYDGSEIETVVLPATIPYFGAVRAIARRNGRGVVVGGSAGVHIYDGARWSFLPTSAGVVSLAMLKNGQLWMVDQKGDLFHCEEASRVGWDPPFAPERLPGPARLLASDGLQRVWVACDRGVVLLGMSTSALASAPIAVPDPVSAILCTKDHHLWIGTKAGQICVMTAGGKEWARAAVTSADGMEIRCMAEDRRGRIWASGGPGRVYQREASGDEWSSWSSINGMWGALVNCILADREGGVWFGFNGFGLLQWKGEEWTHRTNWAGSGPSPSGPGVFGINGTADGAGFLAAMFNFGILRWDGTRALQFGPEDGLSADTRCAVEPSPGEIWVGVRYGIYESRGGQRFRQTLRLPTGFVQGLFHSPSGDWYAGTSTLGVYVRRGSIWTPESAMNAALRDLNVRGMTWRRNGELWIATMRGVAVLDKGETHWLDSGLIPALPSAANCVLDVSDEEVWVGGMGGIGVNRSGRWERMTAAEGVPGRTVYALAAAPDGTVWAGGSEGVGRWSRGRWQTYDARDGLIEDECNLGGLWIAGDGSVFVGTLHSLARFDPSIQPLPPAPLRCFWRETPPAGTDGVARLPASQGQVHLAWAAPWLLPRAVEYRTRVLQVSDSWSLPGKQREMTLQRLGSGYWDVEVAARVEGSGDEGWIAPIRTRIYIQPYFWEGPWVVFCFVVIGLAAVALVVRLRTRRLARRAADLQTRIDEAIANMRIMRGLLPICAHCKKIRDDAGYWKQIESYVREHSEADFSHGICPECMREHYPEIADRLAKRD